MGGEEPGLEVWVVYDHPSDYPDFFVARKQIVMNGQVHPTQALLMCSDVGALREALVNHGLTCITRDPNDDPVIVESWI